MLTEVEIQQNKMKYLDLLTKLNVDLTELTKYLDAVGFWTAPAGTQTFGAYPGALVQRGLNFYYELSQLCNAYTPGRYTQQDVIKVMLGKELYRAEMYEAFKKPVKNEETGQWDSVVMYRTKEVRPTFGDIGLSSYMILKKFIELTDEQALAIIHFKAMDYAADIYDIMKSYPLVSLTRMADIAMQFFD